jgi:peptidoglycan/LPS O-acetylase OafA/YrhL
MAGAELNFHVSRVRALDGVRAIAILLVFAVHTKPPLLLGGRIGVDLFFVLSGFLITSILLQEYRQTGSIHLGYFYIRRALRLFPALASVIVFGLLYTRIFHPEKMEMTINNAMWVAGYAFNWKIISLFPNWLEHQWLFSHVWSLSVEEQFYIVWPIITLSMFCFGASQRTRFAIVIAGIVLPAIFRAVLWNRDPTLAWYFNTFLRFDGLMWGAFAAMLIDAGFLPTDRLKVHVARLAPVGFVGLVAIATREGLSSGFLYQFGFTLAGLFSAILIYCSAVSPLPWFTGLLELKPLRWIGMVSYGLYLWHIPVIVVVMELKIGPVRAMLLEAAATFTVATLSFYYYEKPFLRAKARFTARKKEFADSPATPLTVASPKSG